MNWTTAVIIGILFLPLYTYVLSKSATMGKITAQKQMEEKING